MPEILSLIFNTIICRETSPDNIKMRGIIPDYSRVILKLNFSKIIVVKHQGA